MYSSKDLKEDALASFDADAPITNGRLFGLPDCGPTTRIEILPVPWDATASYGKGSSLGPDAIVAASGQIDLRDRLFGEPWRSRLRLLDEPDGIRALNEEIAKMDPDDPSRPARIGAGGEIVRSTVRRFAEDAIGRGCTPVVLGGEHSVILGAVEAVADRWHEDGGPVGILQIDAHMDLRSTYEGFQHSHASIMHNVLKLGDPVASLTQVGIRDWCRQEEATAAESERVTVFYDDELDRTDWAAQCRAIVATLPKLVYVSIDIDGLDPSLCPSTGTPVPGGLGWRELGTLLREIVQTKRRVVGADLVEVAPGASDWDANVGARVLYRLCGLIDSSRSESAKR